MYTVMQTLVRRELWEHRALWIAPLVVAAVILLGALIADVHLHMDFGVPLPEDRRQSIFVTAMWTLTIPQFFVMTIVLLIYATECLYTERKDRSILFWKSMPVSDAQTVASKLLIALVLVPLAVYVIALITHLIASGIWAIRFGGRVDGGAIWDTALWVQVQGFILLGMVISMLWYAPIVAYLLLLSAWARRNVFLWAALPPLLLMTIENIATDTSYVSSFIGYRLGGVWRAIDFGPAFAMFSAGGPVTVSSLLRSINAAPVLSNVDLWLGLLAAAAFVYGAIRIRRYRDDT